ncbi:uncharacterized protein PAC_03230 [Phialocephala subalpina]|uniref:Uncharacterized protein n=1 Tax=Phialocephala subalpina TaxID=576137 RepID=A0A1L7WKP8_9HELO|nr:uncharacterized protein PAC_03230 [Phialocephala subalpina]
MSIGQSQFLTIRIKNERNDIKMEFKMEEGEIEGSARALRSPTPLAPLSTPKRSRRDDPRRRQRSSGTSSSLHSSAHRHRRRTSSDNVSGQQNSCRPRRLSSPHRPFPTSPPSLSCHPPSSDRPKPFIDSYCPNGNAYAPGDTPAKRGVPESDRWRPSGYGRTPRQRGVQESDFYRPVPQGKARVENEGLSWAEMAAKIMGTGSEQVPPTQSVPPTKSIPPTESLPPKKSRSGLFAYEDEEF